MTGSARGRPPLTRKELDEDPVRQFTKWFGEVMEEGDPFHPNAMCLSTLDADGYPSARIVLLKDHDARGFVFYTNMRSRKGRSLHECPRASVTFYWERSGRQIRIQGDVTLVSEEEADRYFSTRPKGSRLGAWASDQSEPVDDREAMERRFRALEERFGKDDVPRPAHWSGYRLRPVSFEFWQEGENRLHDRFQYTPSAEGWRIVRLYP